MAKATNKTLAESEAASFAAVNKLLHAAAAGDVETVRQCLDSGTDINATDNDGYFALSVAINLDQLNIVELLISRKANLNIQVLGKTPLQDAMASGRQDIAKMLIRAGAKPETSDMTALHLAAELGMVDLAKKVIAEGANINQESGSHPFGLLPLALAIGRRQAEIAKLLLIAGADPDRENSKGRTAREVAGGIFYDAKTSVLLAEYDQNPLLFLIKNDANKTVIFERAKAVKPDMFIEAVTFAVNNGNFTALAAISKAQVGNKDFVTVYLNVINVICGQLKKEDPSKLTPDAVTDRLDVISNILAVGGGDHGLAFKVRFEELQGYKAKLDAALLKGHEAEYKGAPAAPGLGLI